jgi:phosphohistidine swiveling domain-containing protein
MQQVPATDDFTITWPDPAMAKSSWSTDRMHHPGPITPLAQHVIGGFLERVMGSNTIFANGYQYSFGIHLPDPTPEVTAGGLDVWRDDYSPRIRVFCERVRNTDFDAMTAPELAATLDPLADEALECLRLTMVVVSSFMQPTFDMLEFLEGELGADGPMLSGALIQGSQNASAAPGVALAALTALARQSPDLAAALLAGDFENLDQHRHGREFLDELASFLDEFGARAESWGAMHIPTWSEDRSKPLALIARYLTAPNSTPAAVANHASDQHATALAEVKTRLDPDKLEQFHTLLDATSHHVDVSEDRARWQLSSIGVTRLPALALGRKLVAAGALDSPDDIFYLTWDEAHRAAEDPGDWTRTAAREGRSNFTHWEQLTAPPRLGSPPDLSTIDPSAARMSRHFLGMRAPSIEDGVIKGHPASRGTVTGRARIIRHLDESDRLEPGDIMVCATTAPPWTALFAIAAAVVTDTGGVMSHSAICAREFAIPCVVGTQVGTTTIPDGATITVDGEAGTVTILPDSPAGFVPS